MSKEVTVEELRAFAQEHRNGQKKEDNRRKNCLIILNKAMETLVKTLEKTTREYVQIREAGNTFYIDMDVLDDEKFDRSQAPSIEDIRKILKGKEIPEIEEKEAPSSWYGYDCIYIQFTKN